MSDSKRPLLKGPLRSPQNNPSALSYTEPPRSKGKVSIDTRSGNIKVVEFNGSAYPQPFLDPSIMQKRAQLGKTWNADQEKIKPRQLESGQTGGSSES